MVEHEALNDDLDEQWSRLVSGLREDSLGVAADCCSSQAARRVVLPSMSEVLLCAHHSRAHAQTLADAGATVVDGSGHAVPVVAVLRISPAN